MKQIIKNYSFNASARTITFTDFTVVQLDRLLLITNVTANVVVYQFNAPALGGAVSGNVLTLALDTAAMNNSDKLQIIYDCAAGDPLYDAASNTVVQATYHATPLVLSDGQRSELQLDANGYLMTTLGTALVAEDNTTNAFRTQGISHDTVFSVTTPQAVGATDVSAFKGVSVHITSQGSGSLVSFQCSNDNANWIPMQLYDSTVSASSGVVSATSTAGRLYYGPLPAKYFRLNISGITSGITAGTIVFTSQAPSFPLSTVAQGGTWTFGFSTSSTSTVSNLASSTTSQTVLATNTSRKHAAVFNDSTAALYLKLNSAAASPTSYTVQIAAGGYYEFSAPIYTGAVTGIWAAANGFARITEWT